MYPDSMETTVEIEQYSCNTKVLPTADEAFPDLKPANPVPDGDNLLGSDKVTHSPATSTELNNVLGQVKELAHPSLRSNADLDKEIADYQRQQKQYEQSQAQTESNKEHALELVIIGVLFYLFWFWLKFKKITLRDVLFWLSLRPQAAVHIFLKVWRGEYSLSKLLVGFFILGGFFFPIILRLPFVLTGTYDPVILFPCFIILFLAYRIVTTVGVWRAANKLAATYYKPGVNLVGVTVPFRAFMVKLFVFIWIINEASRITGLKFIDVIKYFAG